MTKSQTTSPRLGLPLSRWSPAELGAHVRRSGLVATVSGTTIWRSFNEDAIRPWHPHTPVAHDTTRAPLRIEHEYRRLGAWAYLAALDVHRFHLFGRERLLNRRTK